MEKSAKDLAFDRERAAYKKAIRELQSDAKKAYRKTEELKERIETLEAQKRELEDWVERLLVYTEMDKKDMIAVIQKEKEMARAMEHVNTLFSFGVPNSMFRI